jgi:hypothetical protein
MPDLRDARNHADATARVALGGTLAPRRRVLEIAGRAELRLAGELLSFAFFDDVSLSA